jgi:transposase-like protein
MKNSNQSTGQKGQNGRICKHDFAFRHHVARAYREGNYTTAEVARMFDVTYEQVSGWVREFSSDLSAEPVIAPMTEQEQNHAKKLALTSHQAPIIGTSHAKKIALTSHQPNIKPS